LCRSFEGNIQSSLFEATCREAGVTANALLSLIDRMKHDVSPLSMRYYDFKANVYATLGNIALAEGTEESAGRAVAHFENQLKVNEVTKMLMVLRVQRAT
jgi:hypothetical protein